MPDINDLFEQFPDYDVFSGKTAPANRAKAKKSVKPQEPEPRSNTDYGDGFGKADKPVRIKRNSGGNFLTVFFFPVLILWLEISLRLGCQEAFEPISILYLVCFSLPIAFALTLICTFTGRKFNLVLCNIFTFTLTVFYAYELIYFSVFKRFFSFSHTSALTAQQITDAIIDRKFYLIAIIIPFIFNLLIGHKIFSFQKLRFPAKITLVLVAVLIQLIGLTMVSISKDTDVKASSYNIYHGEFDDGHIQERFGILTMERLDAFPSE